MRLKSCLCATLLLGFVCLTANPKAGCAQTASGDEWNAYAQATYIAQLKKPLHSPYAGANSLQARQEQSYSFTTTAMLGWRPSSTLELYFNPEAAQGVALSGLSGLGGFTNGEMARSSGSTLKAYQARLFARNTWNLGGEQQTVSSAPNQVGGVQEARRVSVTAGNLSVLDIFDGNGANHDPRTQFLNWSMMTHGAYDFAADARGYSWGVASEWFYDQWTLRIARFLQPQKPNQQALDFQWRRHYGDQMEVEHAHDFGTQTGKTRLLLFRNRAVMARYEDALALAASSGSLPNINLVRNKEQTKLGAGLNIEQSLNSDVTLFARTSWADGQTETYSFTEIDRSLSAGALVNGRSWGRVRDSIGVGFSRNHLSKAHRRYLGTGGLGFFLGDGRLNYDAEKILEVFYLLGINKTVSVTADWQHINSPAYNRDRGPVNLFAFRLHLEF